MPQRIVVAFAMGSQTPCDASDRHIILYKSDMVYEKGVGRKSASNHTE